jgi:hypothetical protein
MRATSNRLFEVFRRLDGARFMALLGPLAEAPTKDQMPYRKLMVKSPGIASIGAIVVDPGGRKILLLETAPDFAWAEAYRVAYVSHQYAWKRRVVVTDPVSKVKRDTGLSDMGLIYAYFEKPEAIMFQGTSETKYRFLTGQDVVSGDIIDGRNVKRVYDVMGVKAVELE